MYTKSTQTEDIPPRWQKGQTKERGKDSHGYSWTSRLGAVPRTCNFKHNPHTWSLPCSQINFSFFDKTVHFIKSDGQLATWAPGQCDSPMSC